LRDLALRARHERRRADREPVSFRSLAPWLSDYGRCVLVAQREDCVNPRVDVSRGILHGTPGGRYPITLVYGSPAGDAVLLRPLRKVHSARCQGEHGR